MSSKWDRVQISNVCELIIDCVNKTAPQVNYETPYKMIRTPNVRNGRIDLTNCRYVEKDTYQKWTRRATVEPDDILLTREAPMGEVGLVDFSDTVFLGQRIMQYRVDKDVLHPRFLLYTFLSADLQNQFRMHDGTGSVVSHIRVPDCSKFEINLPPLSEQNRIVGMLGSLDDKIQLNHQINQTLEQMAQTLFKSWFVDFEPVKAKIAARERWQALQPENEPSSPICDAAELDEQSALDDLETVMNRAAMQAISGKTAEQLDALRTEASGRYSELYETAALFPSAMQESKLGEIPEGWQTLPLSQMIRLIGGGTPKKSESSYWNGETLWFSVKDVPPDGNVFVIDTESKITNEGLQSSSAKLLPIGTTIITARGTVGKLALTGAVTAMNQSCYGVVGNDGTGPYLNYLRLKKAVETLKRNTHGAVFDTITRATFETVVQPQASLALRNRFEVVVASIFEAIKNNLHQSKNLFELRDTLLPKLLSGTLTIPSVEEARTEQQEAVHV